MRGAPAITNEGEMRGAPAIKTEGKFGEGVEESTV